MTDAELACLAVAQVLLRYDDERHWLRAAPRQVGHLFPRLLHQSEYIQRLKDLAPLMEAGYGGWPITPPGTAELLRLMDATPIHCGRSVITARRSDLAGWAGYGYSPGLQLTLIRPARNNAISPGTSRTGCASASRRSPGRCKPVRPRTPRGRAPAGLWARIVQRVLALNTAIWHNWQIGAPVKRSLIAYDHV